MTEEQIFDLAKHATDQYIGIAKEQDRGKDLRSDQFFEFYFNTLAEAYPKAKQFLAYMEQQKQSEDQVNEINTKHFV